MKFILYILLALLSTVEADTQTMRRRTGGAPAYTYAFDAASGSGTSVYGSVNAWNHTVTTGQGNRALYVAIGYYDNVGNKTITSCTYNSVSMTQVGFFRDGDNLCSAIYRLLNPATGTNEVRYTLSADGYGTIKGGAWSFTGVNQTTPNGTFATNAYYGSTPATLNVSSVSGNIVISCSILAAGWFTGFSHGADFNLTNTPVFAGQRATATGETTSFSYTLNADQWWSVIGVATKPN